MPIDHHIEPDHGCLRVRLSEPWGIGAIQASLLKLPTESGAGRAYGLLFDLRDIERLPSSNELRDLIDFLADQSVSGTRQAILVRTEGQYGVARMASILGDLQHLEMEVFRDEDAALGFLKAAKRWRLEPGAVEDVERRA